MLLVIKRIGDGASRRLAFVYVSYWCASLAACCINPYGISYKVEDSTYFLLLGHVLSFLVGFMMVKIPTPYFSSNVNIGLSTLLNNKLFIGLFLLCFGFIVFMAKSQVEALVFYSMSEIRGDIVEILLEGDFIASLIYSLIATPFYHFCMAVLFYMLFFERRWLYILLLFIYTLFFSFIGGGRNQYMTFGYYALGLYIIKDLIISSLNGKMLKYVISFKMRMAALSLIVLVVIGMAITTSLRRGLESNNEALASLGFTFVSYSTFPIVCFDYALSKKEYERDFFWGLATINGTEKLISRFASRFTGKKEKIVYSSTTETLQEDRFTLSPGITWNYAFTSCIYYYWDLGFWGVLCIPLVLGYLVRLSIRHMYRNLNFYSISLFIFVSYCMYMSVFSGTLHKNYAIFYILFLIVVSSRCKNRSFARWS